MDSPRLLFLAILFTAAGAVAAAPCPDADRDDFADCAIPGCERGALPCGDCDDGDPAVHPGAVD